MCRLDLFNSNQIHTRTKHTHNWPDMPNRNTNKEKHLKNKDLQLKFCNYFVVERLFNSNLKHSKSIWMFIFFFDIQRKTIWLFVFRCAFHLRTLVVDQWIMHVTSNWILCNLHYSNANHLNVKTGLTLIFVAKLNI